MSDRILGIAGVCLAAFYIWAATIIPKSFMVDAIGPSTFPIIIGMILAICSVVFVLKPDPAPDWPSAGPLLEIAFAVSAMLVYAHLLPKLGFVVSTALATTYLTWRLGSKPLGSVVIGVGTSIGIYIVFRLILGLSLAKGPLGF